MTVQGFLGNLLNNKQVTMPRPDPSDRERNGARTRLAVLDAAERLCAARGFDATSMHDVGAEAGVSRGTPGYFFGSKAAMHQAVLDRCFARVRDAIRSGKARALASGGKTAHISDSGNLASGAGAIGAEGRQDPHAASGNSRQGGRIGASGTTHNQRGAGGHQRADRPHHHAAGTGRGRRNVGDLHLAGSIGLDELPQRSRSRAGPPGPPAHRRCLSPCR